MVDNYIFGIGSLINAESRAKTGETQGATPVRVNGLERAWNSVASDLHMTAVGVTRNQYSYTNGVIILTPENELSRFDSREIGYHRILVNHRNIRLLNEGTVPNGKIWVYATNTPGQPTEKNPIVQSYIDVVLTDCLAYGKEFAREFVETTQGWVYPWINDRNKPRYPRPLDYSVTNVQEIDEILKLLVKEAFNKRKQI